MNLVFIRNPKCATISIRKAIQTHKLNVKYDQLETHQRASQWDRNNTFLSVCRNPYDRLLSGWLFICRRKLPKHKQILIKYKNDFESFVLNLKSDFNMNLYDVDMVTWKQVHWLTDLDGNNIIDELGKFEELDLWWGQLCKKYNWPHHKLTKINSTKHDHWSKHYTPEMIKIVNEQYREDFDLLNYEMITSS